MPKSFGDESQDGFRLINASDIELDFTQTLTQEFREKISYMEVGSNLVPYVGPEEFERWYTEEILAKKTDIH